jgi:hypothetical protein
VESSQQQIPAAETERMMKIQDVIIIYLSETDVPPDALEATMGAQLRSEGFVGAAIVMPGGACGETTVNTSFNWTRICMRDDLGGWVGESPTQSVQSSRPV